MYSNIEAQIALAKCMEGNRIYGIRFEKTNQGWKYNWAFPISETRAKSENYTETQILGNIYQDNEYPGCPFCGSYYFYICGCGKLNCYVPEQKTATCRWCGSTGELEDYNGEGFSSAGDV